MEKGVWANEYVERIKNSSDALVKYRDVRPITDIKDMFLSSVELFGDKAAFLEKNRKSGKYAPVSFNEALLDVNGLGTALIAGGFKGKKISVCGENSYKWAVSYLATVCGTGVIVPLDKELSKSELAQLVQMGEVSLVITDKKHLKDFVAIKAEGNTGLEMVISMEAEESTGDYLAFNEIVEAGRNMVLSGDRSFIDADIDQAE